MSAASATLPLGLIDSSLFSTREPEVYLSAAERERYASIRHERRRQEWFSGRVAAKFVFLDRMRRGAPDSRSGLSLLAIDAASLGEFSEREYRQAEVQTDPSPGGGPARVGFAGGADPVQVSISHGHGLACAFIGTSEGQAVDLEKCDVRGPAFYARNFTARETQWTRACHQRFGLEPSWLYTLLWSAKECLLKTPAFRSLSLWNIGAIEIDVRAGSGQLKRLHDRQEFSSTFEVLEARVGRAALQVAVAGTAGFVVTAITNIDGLTLSPEPSGGSA